MHFYEVHSEQTSGFLDIQMYSGEQGRWHKLVKSEVHKIQKCKNYFQSILLGFLKNLVSSTTVWKRVTYQISTILNAQLLSERHAKKGQDAQRVCFFASLFTSERPGILWSRNLKSHFLSCRASKMVEIWNTTLFHTVFEDIRLLRNPNEMDWK